MRCLFESCYVSHTCILVDGDDDDDDDNTILYLRNTVFLSGTVIRFFNYHYNVFMRGIKKQKHLCYY